MTDANKPATQEKLSPRTSFSGRTVHVSMGGTRTTPQEYNAAIDTVATFIAEHARDRHDPHNFLTLAFNSIRKKVAALTGDNDDTRSR